MKRLLALLLATLLLTALLVGCVERSVITEEEFISEMKARGFSLEHIEYSGELKRNPITADNGKYEILFYNCTDAESARSLYDRAVGIIEADTDIQIMSFTISGNDYNYRSLNNNDCYFVVSRVENTVMLCYGAPKEYRDEIIQLMTDLGYDS